MDTCLGLIVSALIAYSVGTLAPLTQLVFGTPLFYVVQWGPIVLLLGSNFLMRNPSPAASGFLYWAVVSLIGASLSFWVILATSGQTANTLRGSLSVDWGTIAQAFFITSSAFLALSVFGYTTTPNPTCTKQVRRRGCRGWRHDRNLGVLRRCDIAWHHCRSECTTHRPHHGEVLALLFRCQCLDRFLTFLWGQPAAGSAVLEAGPVQGMATHDDNPWLVVFCPGCDKPSQRPARFELFLAEGS